MLALAVAAKESALAFWCELMMAGASDATASEDRQ
jgi:hypothetical protein